MNRASNRGEHATVSAAPAFTITPATAGDAPAIADLIDLAGEGIPRAIWRHYAPAEQEPHAFGAERAAVGSGNFSWRNVHLARHGAAAAGMVLAYRLPEEPPDLADLHPLEVPLVELEACVPGTFYVNALAVYPGTRRQGVGRRLLEVAHRLARGAGCAHSSLIVFAGNRGALRLYRKMGYAEQARRPPLDHPDFRALGECLLLTREVGRRG